MRKRGIVTEETKRARRSERRRSSINSVGLFLVLANDARSCEGDDEFIMQNYILGLFISNVVWCL